LADCHRCKAAERNDGEGEKPVEKQNENGNDHKKCWNFKEKGHVSKNCPNKQKDQTDAFFVGVTLNNKETEMRQRMPIEQHEQAEKRRSKVSAPTCNFNNCYLETPPESRNRWDRKNKSS